MQERIPKIVVAGPAYVDMAIKCEYHPTPGEMTEGSGFTCIPTGPGVNEAIQIALCGCESYLLARVGQDSFGELIRQTLRRFKVYTDLVYSTNAMSTGIVVTFVNNIGENCSCRSQGANRVMGRDEIEYAAAEQAIGTADAILVNDTIPQSAMIAAIRSAQIHKTRVVLDAMLERPNRDVVDSLDWPMEYYNTDIIVLRFKGITCASELTTSGEGDLKFIGTELVAKGAQCVVISLGWRGALVIDRQGPRRLDGIPGEVVDQTGCNAAFTGALTACYGSGDSPERAVKFAIVAENLTRGRFGLHDAMPNKEEILTELQKLPD